MKKNIFISIILLLNCLNGFSQVFSNSTTTAAGSWDGTLTKTVTVSGLSNLNAGFFELVQVNLHMGDNANTRNYNLYRVTLTKGTTSIELVATGGLPNSSVKQINTKFRYNTYLKRLFEHGGTAEPFSIGYYRSQDDLTAFNGIDPNGDWTVTITEDSFATGGRFNKVDLVFKSPYTVQDYTTLNSYDNCSTPYCLGTAEIIVASNNGFTNQTGDMYNSNTAICEWNAAQNNSAWFKFRAAQTTGSITISGISGNLQILAIDAGADNNPCTAADNIVLNGGCPTLSSNDTYSSPQYTNGSTKNNQLNLSGLTVGEFYYFIVDGTSSSVSPFYIETIGTSFDCSNCDLNVTLGSNSPVCANGTLNLTCNDGASWSWTGPNGFTSNSQNPTLNNVTSLASGTYTVAITDINGCSDTKSIDVVVNSSVTPTFNTPSPVCIGSTLNPLPTTSNNGIQGQWSPALNNSATTIYTFTPNPGQCASTTTLTITVNNCDFGAYASAVWMDDCTELGDGKFYNTTGGGADLINQEPGNTFIKDFGVHVANSSSLIFRGGEVKTYKNGGTNVCGAKMYYRYYLTSATAGTFTPRNLAFISDCNTSTSEFPNGGGPCVAGQQKWQCVSQPGCDAPINLTTVPPGDYTLEVYYDVTGDFNSTTQCDDTIILNNGGTNYKANFSIIAVPTLTNTNPTTCNGSDGSITISGLTSNEVYALSYTFNTAAVGPNNYTSNNNGEVLISNLGIGTYSGFSFVINSCTTVLTSSVTLQNPVIIPVFSTPNPYCYGANVPSTVLPTTSNNGITGSWLPAINNTATTNYTFTPDAGQCATTTNLTVVINLEITGSINSNPNTICNASSTNCEYTGPIAFINEVMYMPGTNFSVLGSDNANADFQSLYNNSNTGQEWIEIYNPNPCVSLDLGCYVLGSDTSAINSGAFSFPSGTTIPPLGFLTIGAGPNVDMNLYNYVGTSSLVGSNRWHLENGCGYILLANPSGVIIDALYWSQNNASDLTESTSCEDSFNSNLNIPNQCNPAINPLPKPRDISNIVYVGNFGATAQGSANIGRTISRTTDGANTFVISPQLGGTPGNCNGVCTPPFSGGSTCNGSATVTITQGSGNYSYLWNDSQAQTTATATNLCAGNYCVTVTDLDTNCTYNNCITVGDDTLLPVLSTLTSTTPICYGGNAVFALTGTPNATVSYTINTGANQTVILDATGNATVTVNTVTTNTTILLSQISLGTCDATISNTATVVVSTNPTFGNLTATTPVCSGGNAVFALTGTPNATVSYTINTGANQTVILDATGNATVSINSVTTNTTILLSQISLGTCDATISNTATVVVSTNPTFGNLTATTPVCSGGNAVFTLTGTPNATVTYTINTGANQSVLLNASGNATVTVNAITTATTILLSQISLGSCNTILNNTITVIVNQIVTPTFGFGTSLTACQGDVSIQVLLPTLSNNSISGSWNPSTIDYSIVGQTVYTFTPNAGQCSLNTTLTVTINPTPQFTITGGCDGEDYVLQIAEQNQDIIDVKWYYDNDLIGQGTSIIISDEGLYTAVVTNTNNCQSDADINVTNSFCTIPKGVSANNDGDNDFFELSNLDVKKLQIFNRYGMVIYTKNNYTNEWGGQSDTGDQVPDGTYYYVIEQYSGKVKTGWVYLIRQL
jgi:gliding motility-associated-like protein